MWIENIFVLGDPVSRRADRILHNMLATIVEKANLLVSLTFARWISSPEFRGGGRKDVLLSASSYESGTGKTLSQLRAVRALIDRKRVN